MITATPPMCQRDCPANHSIDRIRDFLIIVLLSPSFLLHLAFEAPGSDPFAEAFVLAIVGPILASAVLESLIGSAQSHEV